MLNKINQYLMKDKINLKKKFKQFFANNVKKIKESKYWIRLRYKLKNILLVLYNIKKS